MKKITDNKPIHTGHRERVKEKVEKGGLQHFHPHEIIEFLLFYGIPLKDTNPIAHELMRKFGSFSKIFEASYDDLMNVPHMTRNAALLILSFPHIMREYNNSKTSDKIILKNLDDCINYLAPLFIGKGKEELRLLCLDSKNQLINNVLLSVGTLDNVITFMREIAENAIMSKASAVILAHNHPSMHVQPSLTDITFTQKVSKSLEGLDIRLLDHIIIGHDESFSFKRNGLLNVNNKTALLAAEE